MKLKVVLGLATALALAPVSAFSQSATLTEASLVSQCLAVPTAAATSSTCVALFAQYVQQLRASGLAPTAIDDLIASAVVQLSGSGIPNTAVRTQVAAAIRSAATQISDPTRATRVASIAAVVETGQGFETASTAPLLASDN